MSKTGNRGFTLLEVMVTTAVLSFGIVLVYQSFFVSLDAFGYSRNYLKVASWADEKLWEIGDDLVRYGSLANPPTRGEFISGNKVFKWDASLALINSPQLYKVDLTLSWNEGKRTVKLRRSTNALYHEEE